MKVITIERLSQVPTRFTGMAIIPGFRKFYMVNGQLHCDDGPAVIWNDKGAEWYQEGKLHRLDGPAIHRSSNWKQWWVNGLFIHQNDEAYREPRICNRRLYKLENVIGLVNPEAKLLPTQQHYILLEENIQGFNHVTNKPLMFSRILTQETFAYIPNLPGI